MEQKYLSKRGWIIYFPLALFPFLFSFGLLAMKDSGQLLLIFWIFIPFYVFLLTILKTSYSFEAQNLVLRMSFFRKRIPISSISKLTIGNHFWFAGWKYALTTKGILITYGNYYEVLISPEKQLEFIEKITELNPQIKVEEKKG